MYAAIPDVDKQSFPCSNCALCIYQRKTQPVAESEEVHIFTGIVGLTFNVFISC